ncbi:hypothetical protein NMG60_11002628 [Bertholletia excelsa]
MQSHVAKILATQLLKIWRTIESSQCSSSLLSLTTVLGSTCNDNWVDCTRIAAWADCTCNHPRAQSTPIESNCSAIARRRRIWSPNRRHRWCLGLERRAWAQCG